jgi:hypothetical protein
MPVTSENFASLSTRFISQRSLTWRLSQLSVSGQHFPTFAVLRNVTILSRIGNKKGHDSSVGIALGYGLDERGSGVRFPAGAGNFSLHHRVQNGSGAHQPPIQWVPGALSLGVKRPRREADHSPPSSAEVKNAWSYTSTPPIRLHGVVLR